MGETFRNTYLSRIDITVLFSIAIHTSEPDRCRSKMHKIMFQLTFEGKMGAGDQGDLSLDDVSVTGFCNGTT